MKTYKVFFTEQAREELKKLSYIIIEEYKSPLTAVRYLRNLYEEINKLKKSAESYSIQKGKYFKQFGNNVRRINYKKMTVIYLVNSDTVYVLSIIPSSIIKGF
jgi:mRNA-degrading endonuclease RelE of RelBE toxin-antitoxin system